MNWHLRGGEVFLVIGDRAVFLLVIWWFVPEKIGDLVILKSCGDGDLAIFLLVIWWLVPEKIGDLVILRSCGDGDLAFFAGDLVISTWKKSKKCWKLPNTKFYIFKKNPPSPQKIIFFTYYFFKKLWKFCAFISKNI